MTEDVAPDDLGKRSAVAENGDAGAEEGAAEAPVEAGGGGGGGNEADMGGGAVGEPIWRDGDYIGGKFAIFCHRKIHPVHDTGKCIFTASGDFLNLLL